jgi:predicted nucleic acid-binding protein
MSVFVVDASLVVKWFVPEIYSEAAQRWLASSHEFIAPDLLFPEAGNAIWKKLRRDELTAEEAQRLIGDLERVAVESVTTRTLVSDAVALAIKADITVYDATYLTLAVRLDTAVVTGDDRLARKVARHPALRRHVRSVLVFADE